MTTSFELALPFVPLKGTDVLECTEVTRESLVQLATGDAIAIVVRGYGEAGQCRQAAERLFTDAGYKEYDNLPGVYRWGLNSSESMRDPDRKKQYFADAMPTVRALRSIWAPHLSPIDRLRLELQESWPAGANLEYYDGQGLFVGQARVFGEMGALPHQDYMLWELASLRGTAAQASDIQSQLTANIYLQTPDRGGEVQLWSAGYDHDEYIALREQPGVPGLDRGRIPEPTVQITPEPGMLLIFHATRLHAVLPSVGRPRVALSCFIGVRGEDEPLTYWS